MSMLPRQAVVDPKSGEVFPIVTANERLLDRVQDFVTAYGPKLRVQVDTTHGGPEARQEFKEEADINRIMARYQKGAPVTWLNTNAGRFEDVTGYDFQNSMNVIAEANEAFAQLPSSLRKRFGNDPAQMLEFLDDDKNKEEAIKLGLVKADPPPAPVPEPVRVRVIPDDPVPAKK